MAGAGAAAAEVGAQVVGGDLSARPAWSLGVTVLGWASAAGDARGRRPGDGLWVTGALGGARAALEAWQRGAEPDAEARRRFARPVPRLHAGRWLARHGAHAMLDLSDGLGGDAAHLAAASGVALALELERVPVAAPAAAEAGAAGRAAGAVRGGERRGLRAAGGAAGDVRRRGRARLPERRGLPLTRVGEVRAGAGVHATLARHTGRARRLRSFRAAASLTRSGGAARLPRFP